MDAGCLSSKGMLADFKRSISELPVDDPNRKPFSEIHDFILKSLIYQYALKDPEARLSEVTNVEDFVAVLRQMIDREYIVPAPLIGNWNSKITSWEIRNDKVFREFLKFAYDCLIEKWTKFDIERARILVQPFKNLVETGENFDLKIFSLNYDLIFESVFNTDREHLVDTGFSQKQWNGEFDDPASTAKLKLYKLHGSVDWYFDQSDEEVNQGAQEGVRPLIVFGSGPKIQSYDPFLSLLGGFRNALKSSNLFVVVGYSFQDKYINNILIQSLSAGLNKKMIVVDPSNPKEAMDFINKVERFQTSKSMNEIVNLTKISPDRVELCTTKAKDFFAEYLGNNAQKLKQVLETVEQGDRVF